MSITEKCKNNKEANINIDSGADLSLTIVKDYLLIFFFFFEGSYYYKNFSWKKRMSRTRMFLHVLQIRTKLIFIKTLGNSCLHFGP